MQTATPSETEKHDLRNVDPGLLKQASVVAEDPTRYRLTAELFALRNIQSSKRHNPDVLGPQEFQSAVVQAQISSCIMVVEAGVKNSAF